MSQNKSFLVGASAIKALGLNRLRKSILIQNNHGSQTVRVKFGSAPNASGSTSEIQTITFSGIPTSGGFKIAKGDSLTAELAFNANAAAVQVAVRTLPGCSAATVAGDFTNGFAITFAGTQVSDIEMLRVEENTLEKSATREVQALAFGEEPEAGSFKLKFQGSLTDDIAFDASAADVQSALRQISGLGSVEVSGDFANDFVITFKGYAGNAPLLEVVENSLTGANTVEVQLIEFDAVPDTGAFTLEYGAEETASLGFDALAADVQTALRAIEGLEDVTVTGDFTVGFTVTFVGVAGDVDALVEGVNTLEAAAVPVVITISEDTAGEVPQAVVVTPSETTAGSASGKVSASVAETTKGVAADGFIIAANTSLSFDGNLCQAEVYLLASGASTPVEIVED